MEFSGELENVTKDYKTDKIIVSISINEKSAFADWYEKFKDCGKLKIVIDKFRMKRSKDANRYFHVLVGSISEALTISKAKAKNILICKYGQPEILPDGDFLIYKTNAPVEFMLELESAHCIPVKYLDDATFYKVYRGSHTYNTLEMSLLIDGTVADAKDLGIDTVSPDEIRKMKERWSL